MNIESKSSHGFGLINVECIVMGSNRKQIIEETKLFFFRADHRTLWQEV